MTVFWLLLSSKSSIMPSGPHSFSAAAPELVGWAPGAMQPAVRATPANRTGARAARREGEPKDRIVVMGFSRSELVGPRGLDIRWRGVASRPPRWSIAGSTAIVLDLSARIGSPA